MSTQTDTALSVLAIVLVAVAGYLFLDDLMTSSKRHLASAELPHYASAPREISTPSGHIYDRVPPQPTYVPVEGQVPTWRNQGHKDLPETSSGAQPKDYGLPSLDWSLKEEKEVDAPWTGAQNARNLSPGRNPQYHVPLLSYTFPAAGSAKNVSKLKTADTAGFHETGAFAKPGRDVTNTEQSLMTYRDTMSSDLAN